uniref:Thioredoxin, mitochondrial n=1 Tax=Canis lupus familiaris TaxID=9615 RepID=A0A8C0MJZ2_CANLF
MSGSGGVHRSDGGCGEGGAAASPRGRVALPAPPPPPGPLDRPGPQRLPETGWRQAQLARSPTGHSGPARAPARAAARNLGVVPEHPPSSGSLARSQHSASGTEPAFPGTGRGSSAPPVSGGHRGRGGRPRSCSARSHAPSRPFRSWTPPPPPLPDPPLGPARLFRPRPRGPPLFRAPEGPPLLPVLPPANPPPLPFSLPLPHQKPVFRSLTEAPPLPLCRLPPSPLVGNPSHPSSCGEKRSGLPVPGSDVRKALPPEVTKGVPLTGGEGRAVSASLRSGCREMAQRLLLRRFLASVISRKPPQGRWAPLTCRALPCSPGHLTATPTQARSIYTTRVCTTTFNIQDGPDFQDRVVNSETPVVVDFHAQWCGPCKILGPRLEKVVAKQHGKVVMAKVDIDDHTDLALEYEVSAVPTVLAIKNGDVVDKFVGIKDEDQLEAFLKKLIG